MSSTRSTAAMASLPQISVCSGLATGASARTVGERRSEEHTSELQSLTNLVCRLLLEKKKELHRTDQVHRPNAAARDVILSQKQLASDQANLKEKVDLADTCKIIQFALHLRVEP